MKRRLVMAAPLVLAGCGLSERPYVERRDWLLDIANPSPRPPPRRGQVLLVRTIRAGPGLDARGLQSIQPDGSIRTSFYEEWAVAPAVGVEDALRRWLVASGRFAAVTAPGSRLPSDLVLEGELTALWSEPAQGVARVAIGVTVIAERGAAETVRLARAFSGTAPLPDQTPQGEVEGMRAALAAVFGQIQNALATG